MGGIFKSKKLEWLDVSSTQIGNNFIMGCSLPSLRHLGLEDTTITSVGLKYLASSPSSASLQSVCLRGTSITSQEVMDLAGRCGNLFLVDVEKKEELKLVARATSLVGDLIQDQFDHWC
jgi:hypothetical protein